MWLVEKNPVNDQYFLPINLDNVKYISTEEENEEFCIKFSFITESSNWVKWWFKNKELRDELLIKIYKKLPNIKLNDISL